MTPELIHFQLFVAAAFFLAACHAYCQVSPFFCATWFGSSLVFGYALVGGLGGPDVVLLPGLVVYTAAAMTKGLVESRPSLAGAHSLHVIMTGALSGLLALPWLAVAKVRGWSMPAEAGRELLGVPDSWLGGLTLDAVLLWAILGTLVYGVYKVLDHVGLPRPLQVVALFASQPFMADAVLRLHAQL